MSIRNTQPAGLYVISGVTESIQIRIEHLQLKKDYTLQLDYLNPRFQTKAEGYLNLKLLSL